MEESKNIPQNGGIVKISDEVVSVIAGIAVDEIEGIEVCNQGVTNNITNKLFKGKKNIGKASKVTLVENIATIDLSVSVVYGTKINEAVSKAQENVKTTVEAMTGLKVGAVNIVVADIHVKESDVKNFQE